MGSGNSKPSDQSVQHIFARDSDTPVRFSEELKDSLQGSPESDFTRHQTVELHIQNRVTEELKRLEAREAKIFKDTEAEISREGSSGPKDPQRGGRDAKAAGDKLRDLGREGIQKDITTLRQKLESRKKLEALDKSVEKAKDDVITCLRMNDRRPLDCWKEVETFRLEVGKLEKDFVDKALA